jgi:hypothetical protein
MKNNLIPEYRARELIRDRNRRLMQMNTRWGPKWFIVPGGEVSAATASRLRQMPNIVGAKGGLFPGLDQTWKISGGRP